MFRSGTAISSVPATAAHRSSARAIARRVASAVGSRALRGSAAALAANWCSARSLTDRLSAASRGAPPGGLPLSHSSAGSETSGEGSAAPARSTALSSGASWASAASGGALPSRTQRSKTSRTNSWKERRQGTSRWARKRAPRTLMASTAGKR